MSLATSTLKYLLYAFLLSSYKSVPLAYYFRFYSILLKNTVLPKPLRAKYTIKSPFHTSIHKTYNSPLECDMYMHKSNSTYFEELDIARSQLMTSVLQKFFSSFPTESGTWPYVPVASVFCSFKREIKPFASYEVRSSVHSWSEKWLFILSKFVTKGKDGDVICATAVTKYVLKDGRKTIPPAVALKFEGLWNEEWEKQNQENLKAVEYFIDTNDLEVFEQQL